MEKQEIQVTYQKERNQFAIATPLVFGAYFISIKDLRITMDISTLYRKVVSRLAEEEITDEPYFTFNDNRIGWIELCHRISCIREGIPDGITKGF